MMTLNRTMLTFDKEKRHVSSLISWIIKSNEKKVICEYINFMLLLEVRPPRASYLHIFFSLGADNVTLGIRNII